MKKRYGTVIGVFSGKGGAGKTTAVVNVSLSLAQKMKDKVLLVETTLPVSTLGLYFGITKPPISIQDILMGRENAEKALITYKDKLDILLGPTDFAGESGLVDICSLIDPLKRKYSIILIDSPPGFGIEVNSSLRVCDEILIVCQPEIPSLFGALQTLRRANEWRVSVTGIIVNRVTKKNYEISVGDIKNIFEERTIFVIPEDSKVPQSIAKGVPIVVSFPNSPAAVEFNRLAQTILARIRTQRYIKYPRKKSTINQKNQRGTIP